VYVHWVSYREGWAYLTQVRCWRAVTSTRATTRTTRPWATATRRRIARRLLSMLLRRRPAASPRPPRLRPLPIPVPVGCSRSQNVSQGSISHSNIRSPCATNVMVHIAGTLRPRGRPATATRSGRAGPPRVSLRIPALDSVLVQYCNGLHHLRMFLGNFETVHRQGEILGLQADQRGDGAAWGAGLLATGKTAQRPCQSCCHMCCVSLLAVTAAGRGFPYGQGMGTVPK
jgi:hypothetical protein